MVKQKAKSNAIGNTIFMTIIALLPVLNLYKAMASFSIADLLIIVISAYCIIKSKGRVCIGACKPLISVVLTIMITWVIDTGIATVFYGAAIPYVNSFFSAVRVALYYLFVALIIPRFDWKVFLKSYRFLALLFTGVLFFQFLVHLLTGNILLGYFKFLPLMDGNVDSEKLIQLNTYSTYRPYSIFTEPGMFVRYVLPYVAIALFDEKGSARDRTNDDKKKVLEILAISIACLLSKSGQGIAVLVIEFVAFLIIQTRKGKIGKQYAILLLIAIIGAGYYLTTDLFRETLIRLAPTGFFSFSTAVNGTRSSFNTRILRGFMVFNALPLAFKLIGIGYGNQSSIVRLFDIRTPYDQANNSGFMNGAAYTLVNTGIIGFILFLLVFLRTIVDKRNNNVRRVVSLIALVLSFIGGTTISVFGILYYVIMFSYPDTETK